MKSIAVLGECMVELQYEKIGLVSRFGGDTYNTAVYFSRLVGQHWDTYYVSAVGPDPLSESMLSQWKAENLKTDWTQRIPDKLPGIYLIETDDQGERRFHYWRDQAAARYWLSTDASDSVLAKLLQCDALYLSGISLAVLPTHDRERLVAFLSDYRRQGGMVIFDNNYRPRLWSSRQDAQSWYRAMLKQTDLAFLTLDDEQALWDSSDVKTVLTHPVVAGVQEIVIKQGSQPAVIRRGNQEWEVPALQLNPEHVVDTTAAGDAFSAGYMACRLNGGSVGQSAEQGHSLAATVIQHAGAILSLNCMPPSPVTEDRLGPGQTD